MIAAKARATLAVLAIVTVGWAAMSWTSLGGKPERPTLINPRPDQRLHVEATVSWEASRAVPAVASWTGMSGDGPQTIDAAHGWRRTATAWKREFGPFDRGQTFGLYAYTERGLIRVALRTVSKPQREAPPQRVISSTGGATATITVGD